MSVYLDISGRPDSHLPPLPSSAFYNPFARAIAFFYAFPLVCDAVAIALILSFILFIIFVNLEISLDHRCFYLLPSVIYNIVTESSDNECVKTFKVLIISARTNHPQTPMFWVPMF